MAARSVVVLVVVGLGVVVAAGSRPVMEKGAPAPAEGAVRWAVQECGASIALVAVSRGWRRKHQHELKGAVRVGGAGV